VVTDQYRTDRESSKYYDVEREIRKRAHESEIADLKAQMEAARRASEKHFKRAVQIAERGIARMRAERGIAPGWPGRVWRRARYLTWILILKLRRRFS
jgi:hypothetical protein